MPINTLYAAESWDKIYKAFETINFTSFDYETIKLSLLDYLKFYYPENFNDYIESSAFIALIESFAYVTEQLAYRQDLSAHEVFISTTQRKQNILKLAKLISYNATRNIPLRGLVKITSVSTSEDVVDALGNSLTNRNIRWNDPNNPFWKEQFFLVMNKILSRPFGNPLKSFQVYDTIYQLYEISNNVKNNSFVNGVVYFNVNIAEETIRFELVPADVDEHGVFERTPSTLSNFTILYADDGYGDASDTTGFMMYMKQGKLNKIPFIFDNPLQNRMLDVDLVDINNTDVWVQQYDPITEQVLSNWTSIENVNSQNIFFNISDERKKYEIETLENDKIRLLFGDGDFAEIPVGYFNIWVRTSINRDNLMVQKSKIVDNLLTFGYKSRIGTSESSTFRFSLTTTLNNGSASENIEHIRRSAPSTFYSQNRMVNGQDYNTFMLKEPSILRLKAVNRTFAGESKYIRWNDPSGQYQNVKIFGDDLRLYQNFTKNSQKVAKSSRKIINDVIEPLLSTPGIINALSLQLMAQNAPFNKVFIRPRTKFIEDVNTYWDPNVKVGIQEKTRIQSALDRHWYGEPDSIIYYPVSLDIRDTDNSTVAKKIFAVVDSDTDKLIYDNSIELVKKNLGLNVTGFDPLYFPYVKVNKTVSNTSGLQESTNRFKRFGIRFQTGRPMSGNSTGLKNLNIFPTAKEEFISIQVISNEGTLLVYGTKTGIHSPGKFNTQYIDDSVSFILLNDIKRPFKIGDTFIFEVQKDSNGTPGIVANSLATINIAGEFKIIDESSLTDNVINSSFDPTSSTNSWLIIVERIENITGDILYWNVITRDLTYVVESNTTKFWYNSQLNFSDSDTKKKVKDRVSVLKSNLNKEREFAVGTNQIYDVVGDVKNIDGTPNNNALLVLPVDSITSEWSEDGYPDNPSQFVEFVADEDYVYFEIDENTKNLKPIKSSPYLLGITEWVDDSYGGRYVRKRGREELDFLWQHFTPFQHLIDPAVSNIIDIFVLTRSYYVNFINYIKGITNIAPVPPTPLELRNTYRHLLISKMISDTVVMHSGKLKLLFSDLAIPELRASIKVIKNSASKLTNDQLKIKIVDIVDGYFTIDNWDFGQSFYVTELIAVIHKELSIDLDSVVIVPTFPINHFGDLFHIESAEDEILHASISINDIEIIDNLNKKTLKQKI